MNRPTIVSATDTIKLRNILIEDIEILRNFQSGTDEMTELLNSLLDAKYEILSLIPENSEGLGGAPTPPRRTILKSYSVSSVQEEKNKTKLLGILHKIESDQMDFVRESMDADGMPKSVRNIMAKALNIYIKIVDQLDRSKQTQQANMIVI